MGRSWPTTPTFCVCLRTQSSCCCTKSRRGLQCAGVSVRHPISLALQKCSSFTFSDQWTVGQPGWPGTLWWSRPTLWTREGLTLPGGSLLSSWSTISPASSSCLKKTCRCSKIRNCTGLSFLFCRLSYRKVFMSSCVVDVGGCSTPRASLYHGLPGKEGTGPSGDTAEGFGPARRRETVQRLASALPQSCGERERAGWGRPSRCGANYICFVLGVL